MHENKNIIASESSYAGDGRFCEKVTQKIHRKNCINFPRYCTELKKLL